jgi:hypothetical protein
MTTRAPTPPDVTVANHGSVWLFSLCSNDALCWAQENVADWDGDELVPVEHRYGVDLVLAMRADGLVVERPR